MSDTVKTQLMSRFRPALSAPAFSLFERLLEQVSSFRDGGGDLVLQFPTDEDDPDAPRSLLVRAPAARRRRPHPALASFFAVCGGLELGEAGTSSQLVLHDGWNGTLHALGADALPKSIPYAPTLCAPIDLGLQAFYCFSPAADALWFIDEGPAQAATTLDPVEIYLRELGHQFKDVRGATPFQRAFADAAHRSSWLRKS